MAHDANETPVVEYRRRRRSGERILLSWIALSFGAFGLVLALLTYFFGIIPAEGGTVREPIAGTLLAPLILVLSIPGWLGVMLCDQFPLYEWGMSVLTADRTRYWVGMLLGQYLFYWGVGAAVAAIRNRLRARRGVFKS